MIIKKTQLFIACVQNTNIYIYNTSMLKTIQSFLKMLGLYLYTLIIGHKSCNMLSILNKLTLQEELQNILTKNVFLDNKVKSTKHKNET